METKRLSHIANLFSMSITEAFILASIYVMRPPWVQHPILWAKQWYPVAIGRDLNCHLANFLGYILREVVHFVLAKFQWVFAGYQILHLSFVHLGSRYWDYYWWILNHPAAVIRSNIVKVELLAFLLLSFGGSTTFSSFIPIVPQDFFGQTSIHYPLLSSKKVLGSVVGMLQVGW